MIKLPDGQDFRFNKNNVDTIKPLTSDPRDLLGKKFITSGWGTTNYQPDRNVDDLQVVEMEFYLTNRPMNNILYANGDGQKSTCTGDMGGNTIFANITRTSME